MTPLDLMSSKTKRHDTDEESNLFEDYDEFAKVLRTWFVAYGIGGPVLLLTNDAVRCEIATSGYAPRIAWEFLIGVGLQVLLTIFNKVALWGCYKAAREPKLRTRCVYRAAEWFAYVLWIDLLVDVSSFILFALATYRVCTILTAA